MIETDLFGEPIKPGTVEPVITEKGKRKPTRPNGYAAPPGTGPAGETCRTCDNYARVGGHAKTYLKCLLVRAKWTNGPGTDIKAGSPACRFWKKSS